MVSPKNERETIVMLIYNEIKSASMGEEAFIQIKVNNIVDYNIIKKLYEASNAGEDKNYCAWYLLIGAWLKWI